MENANLTGAANMDYVNVKDLIQRNATNDYENISLTAGQTPDI